MCREQRKQHYLPPWGNVANINTDTDTNTRADVNVCIHPQRNQCESARGQCWRSWVRDWPGDVSVPLYLNPVITCSPSVSSTQPSGEPKAWVTLLWLLLRWPLLKQCTSVKKGCVDESSHISRNFCARLPTQATDGCCSDQKQECDWGRWLIWWRETFAFLPQHRDDYSDTPLYGQPPK